VKELSCSNNKLTSLKGIENLVKLKTLNCYNNQLTSLEGIEKFGQFNNILLLWQSINIIRWN
jgi:Leucine-rich repeat (LRR) protein